MGSKQHERELQPADLRGILKYVPMWRDHTFVVALDGALIDEDAFGALMMELAVLHNLGIRLVLGFGIGGPLAAEARHRGIRISDDRCEGPVDAATLELAVQVSGVVQHRIVQAMTQNRIRCAVPNAVRATERGVIKGVDQLEAGKVDKVDAPLVRGLLQDGVVPILPPIAFNRHGRPLRLNSDELASSMATTLGASKLIFMQPHPGLTIRGAFQLNLSVEELERRMSEDPEGVDPEVRSKTLCAIRTVRAGVPRAHLLDARLPDALLTEIFSTVGIGTMVHANPYARIRQARPSDVPGIVRLTKAGVKEETLRRRSKAEVERAIDEYFVYEIDETLVGCCRLSPVDGHPDASELMSVYVQRAYGGRGIGRALVEGAVEAARDRGNAKVFALSTQTTPFFVEVCGFSEIAREEAPTALRSRTQQDGRASKVVVIEFTDTVT